MEKVARKSLLALSRKIIAFNSTNPHGTLGLAQFLGGQFKALGFRVRFQKVRFCGAEQANLIARKGPAQGRPLLINTHLDTVTTHAADWTKTGGNPFRATVKAGRLYGLGAADTKLALACQLTALRSLKNKEFIRPLLITGTYGEEMGLVGVERLLRGNKIPVADVLNSEPTQLRIAKGNKGFRIYQVKGKIPGGKRVTGNFYEIYFSGRSAHSATSHLGDNAILKALKWLRRQKGKVWLVDLDGGLAPNIVAPSALLKIMTEDGEPKGLKDWGAKVQMKKSRVHRKVFPAVHDFLMELLAFLEKKKAAHETQNIGTIQLTAGRYEILLDHRVPPKRNPEILCGQLKRALRNSHVNTLKANPAYTQSSNSPLIKQVQGILRSMKKPAGAHVKPGCTEAGYFAQSGSAALTIGPGRAYGNIHQPNEYVEVKELEEAVEFYRRVFERFCL